jgi:hypothetical protein
MALTSDIVFTVAPGADGLVGRGSVDPEVMFAVVFERVSAEVRLRSSAAAAWFHSRRCPASAGSGPSGEFSSAMSCSKSEAGQRAGGSIPGLVVAGCLWPVAKRVDEPVRTAVDDCVRELAAQLVMFALELVQSVGGGAAFGSDLVGSPSSRCRRRRPEARSASARWSSSIAVCSRARWSASGSRARPKRRIGDARSASWSWCPRCARSLQGTPTGPAFPCKSAQALCRTRTDDPFLTITLQAISAVACLQIYAANRTFPDSCLQVS